MARALVTPQRPTHAKLLQEFEELGAEVPPEVRARIAAQQAASKPKAIEVLECNWNAVAVFNLCQWERVVGMAGMFLTGISANEVQAVCTAARVTFDADLLMRVRCMEAEAAPILNKR